jgi:hypothetical protein
MVHDGKDSCLSNVPVILFPPPEAFMPSMASPFSTEGAGAAWKSHVSMLLERVWW